MIKKSAFSRKPSDDERVRNFINKGIEDSEQKSVSSEDEIMRVQLRISKAKLEEIDKALSQRRVKISRHLWIMEAIEGKLEREKLE